MLAMMEMVLQGVSTRRVARVTEELCGREFSKSTVNRLCEELDARVRSWNERSLREQDYPFVVVDAMQVKVRRDGRVRSTSALIAVGISAEAYREVLGLGIGDSESEGTWTRFLGRLKDRGLSGVELSPAITIGGWSRPSVATSKVRRGSATRRT